jgi:hypothetical protein
VLQRNEFNRSQKSSLEIRGSKEQRNAAIIAKYEVGTGTRADNCRICIKSIIFGIFVRLG